MFEEQLSANKYAGQVGSAIAPYHEPVTKRLRNQLAAIEDRRAKVQALLDLIESNPQFEQLYDLTREVL